MPRKPTGRPPVRPRKPIDWDLVDKMLNAHCRTTEIAARFDMCKETFYERVKKEKGVNFTEYTTKGRDHGKALLRMKQFSEAMNGDRGMLIWLGKNLLEQKDKHDVTHAGNSQVTVVNYSDKEAKKWDEKGNENGK